MTIFKVIATEEELREAGYVGWMQNQMIATENGNVKLWYTVNDRIVASTLDLTDTYKFHVDISHFKHFAIDIFAAAFIVFRMAERFIDTGVVCDGNKPDTF